MDPQEAVDAVPGVPGISEQIEAAVQSTQYNIDTLWIVMAAVLVFFMQAGFALLEGGLVRTKNTINVLMKNYMDMCFGVLIFWAFGFAFMFGNNEMGWIGLSGFGYGGIDEPEPIGGSTNAYAFFMFQAMFAATAATIVSGALAERIRYWPYVWGSMIITGFIYPIYGSWVWGGALGGSGWLANRGFIDFAGSTVVHSVGAWCALAGVIVLKPRLGRFDPETKAPRVISGHNLPLFALGAFVLFFGWFGFNAGSALVADQSIGKIALNTMLAACAGGVGAIVFMAAFRMPILLTSSINGVLGGLVGITAGCAAMAPFFAIVTGLLAGVVVVVGGVLMERMKLDDVVGAVPVHGFCGAWGTLAAGMFQTGALFNLEQMTTQLIGIAAAFLWAFPIALGVYSTISQLVGLRASTVHEQRGLDFEEHYEVGYPEFQAVQLHREKA